MTRRSPISRRSFLKQSACAGIGLAGVYNALSNLKLINATVAAQGVPAGDYKALVCLFLYGGNDSNNILVPRDVADYDAYQAARGILAISRDGLLPITPLNSDGRTFGLHPSLGPAKELFDNQHLAFIANVGTLVAPITKAEYLSGGAAIPPYLFSHNDQQVQWQTSVPDSPKKIGWGGRLADLKQALNEASNISMNISLAGNNFFQVGQQVFQYHVTPGGSLGLNEYTATWAPREQQYAALRDLIALDHDHLFEAEYNTIFERALAADELLKNVLDDTNPGTPPNPSKVPPYTELFTRSTTPTGGLTRLGSQLRMILQLIAARDRLSMRRQIFFCSMGGFDTHDSQLEDHADLLTELANAVADFYHATEALGVANDVTLFSASDFNRTFSSNGKGSDHAWGSHQIVAGGSVAGGRIYGRIPILAVNGPDDTGSRGAWIPTTAVDEFSATLARWFGVSASEMPQVLPNIGRFANPNLGFLG